MMMEDKKILDMTKDNRDRGTGTVEHRVSFIL